VDHLRRCPLDEDFIRSLRPTGQERLVALLPGSRPQEIRGILARQLAAGRVLADRARATIRFVLALADADHRRLSDPLVSRSGLDVRTVVGKTHEVQKAADLALVASGTATLELTYYGTPMVIFYNVTWAQWNLLGRWIVRTPYLGLPNALAGRQIVPEFMRDRPLRPEMMEEIVRMLTNEEVRREVRSALADLKCRIEKPDAAENAARLALRLAGTPVPPPPAYRPGFAI